MSNVRAAYAEVVADYLASGANSSKTASVTARQGQSGWQNAENGTLYARVNGKEASIKFSAKTDGGTYKVSINKSGTVTVK